MQDTRKAERAYSAGVPLKEAADQYTAKVQGAARKALADAEDKAKQKKPNFVKAMFQKVMAVFRM